ncbi:MAG TPA: PH domain-containing protein [Bryobacteraceae bacterium]|nr:PH domain-containing protein [Bryobacteraceae bacterium]
MNWRRAPPYNRDVRFTASYDLTAKIISALAVTVLAGVAIASQSAPAIAVSTVIILVTYAYSPRAYVVAERSIIVERLVGKARVPLEDVREVRAATSGDFRGSIRLWASGGLFGYFGWFRTSTLGRSLWYLTNRRTAVIIVTDTRTTLFSPDDVDGFLAAIRAYAPVVQDAALPPPRHAGGSPGLWIGAAVALVTIGILAFAFLYSPGPPEYTLTPSTLEIHDRFYPVTLPAEQVDLEGIRVVDIAHDPEWRPTARTNGFANTNYHAGWFRVTGGRTVRMYRARGTRLVLLPPKKDGAPVLCEFAEPERFIREVRQVWSNVTASRWCYSGSRRMP